MPLYTFRCRKCGQETSYDIPVTGYKPKTYEPVCRIVWHIWIYTGAKY
jgi:hypothetical protein